MPNPLDPQYWFLANAAPGDPMGYTAQQQRQRIAAQMLSNRKGFPKTLGEGLTSIGDAIGDRSILNTLDRQLTAQSATDKAAIDAAYPQTGKRADAGDDTNIVPPQRTAALTPDSEEEPYTAAKATPPPLVPPPPSNLASVPMPRQAMQVNAATPTFPTSPGFPASTAPRLDPTVQVASDPNYTPAPSTGPTTRGEAAPWLRGAAETNDLYSPRPGAVAQGATNDVQANQLAMLSGRPQQPSPYAPTASLTGGDVQSDAPPITGARDAITNTLMQRQAPPTGVFPPPDQPTPPINLAALQSPPEAQGNRPIVMPDVQPQVMAQAQPAPQAQPARPQAPPPYVMPEPVAPVPPVKDTTLTPLQRKWMPTLLGDTSPVQKGIAKSIIDQEQARKDAAYENEVKNYELKKSIYPSAVEAKRNWDAQRQEKEQRLIATGTPGTPAVDPRILGTPQSPQRSGSPTLPPPPAGTTPEKWSELQAPIASKAIDAVEKATPQFNEAIKTLKLARDHPGRELGVGAVSEYAKKIPGTAAYGFGKVMEQIGGKNFLNAYQQLKGGGSITEIEGTKAEAAQARLATAQNKDDFDKAMIDFESALRTDMETAQRKINAPVTAWRPAGDNSSIAPDIGQVGERKGRPGQWLYVGGNPAADESYRKVQ